MTEQKVSLRFARALINTAQAEKLTEIVYNDLKLLVRMLDSSKDLENLAASPIIRHFIKRNAFKEILDGKVNILTFNFVVLLINKGREGLIRSITDQYEILYYLLNNKLVVEITSAVELTDELKNKAIKQLADYTKKEILATYKIDSSLQGGLKIKIGDWVFDASVKNQLDLLHKKLAEDYN